MGLSHGNKIPPLIRFSERREFLTAHLLSEIADVSVHKLVVVLFLEIGIWKKDDIDDLGLARKERIKIIWQQKLFQQRER